MRGGENTPKKHRGLMAPWRLGQSGNPKGRPRGSRNKLGEEFIRAVHDDFQEHGVAAIQKVRKERPHEYLRVIAGLLPKELDLNVSGYEELSDEELRKEFTAAIREARAHGIDIGFGDFGDIEGEDRKGGGGAVDNSSRCS